MKRRVLQGVAWVGGLMFVVRITRYVALLFLAGILTPRDFGIFASLQVVIDGLALLQGFGLGHALICRRERVSEGADTAFHTSLSIAIGVLVLAWYGAPAVANFYGEESVVGLFRAASAILLFRALSLVPSALFEKALDFKKRLVPTLAGSISYVAVAIVLALRGAGVWSLVVAEVVSALLQTAGYWLVSTWRPRLRFRPELARHDLRFGWAVLGGSILVFAFRNIDRLTIIRLIDTDALGLYAFAYSIASLPATFFVRALNTVLLPSYSSISDDSEQQKVLFFRATTYVGAASLLYAVGAVVLGPHFLRAFYGDKWLGSIAPLSVLVFLALFRSLAALAGDLLVATGEPRTYRKVHGLQLAVGAVGLYFGARWAGIGGAALGMTFGTLALLAASWRAAARILSAGPLEFTRSLWAPLAAAAASAVPAVALSRVAPLMESGWGVIASGAVTALVFVSVWFALDGQMRHEAAMWMAPVRRRFGGD